jgi:hypothetical protein
MGNSPPRPELVIKFWPPSITAKGVEAIDAVRRPMAFAIYSRPVVAIIMGLIIAWAGKDYALWVVRLLGRFVGL